VVDPVGRSGGLALLWMDTVNIEIFNFSQHHINVVVHEGDDNFRWKLTGLYGQPDIARRGETWALLSHLKSFQPTPWLCVGDFNEILDQSERDGAVLGQESLMEHFRDTLEFCGLCDLGYVGLRFTWCNNRFFTRERLVRAVANQEWCSRFLHVIVSVLAAVNSDHHPILVAVRGELNDSRNYKRGFKFKEGWKNDAEFLDTIRSAWENEADGSEPMLDVQKRLMACQRSLSRWSKQKFGKADEELKKMTRQLLELQHRNHPDLADTIRNLKGDIDALLEREDLRWKQRAKRHWYNKGTEIRDIFTRGQIIGERLIPSVPLFLKMGEFGGESLMLVRLLLIFIPIFSLLRFQLILLVVWSMWKAGLVLK
jgi:hypothetical protein